MGALRQPRIAVCFLVIASTQIVRKYTKVIKHRMTKGVTWLFAFSVSISSFATTACNSSCAWSSADALAQAHEYWLPGCSGAYSCRDGSDTYSNYNTTVCICKQDGSVLESYIFHAYAHACDGTLMCMNDDTFWFQDTGNLCTSQTVPPGT